MSLYSRLAEQLQFVSPEFYKSRFFKKQKHLTRENIFRRKVEPEMLWLRDYLPENAVFLDIGANVGAYLYLLEKKLQPKNIFAFEPNAKLYKRLVRLFPKMNIFNTALSDQNGFASFKIPVVKGKKLASRGTLETEMQENDEEKSITKKVQTQKLDDWIIRQKISRIDFIKIDVEGHEMHTIEGASKTLLNHRPALMVEIEQRHHDEPLQQIIEKIEQLGYRAQILDRRNFELKDPDYSELQKNSGPKDYRNYINNIIFLP